MKSILTILALFLVPVVAAQDVARPKVPSADTLASPTSQIKAWYLYAVDCEKQIAALKVQLATAQSSGSGTSSADITAIKTAIAAVDLKVAALIASLKPAENLKVVAGTGTKGATIAWDYNGPTENISGFRIYRSDGDGATYGIVGSTLPNIHTFNDPALAAGTYIYTIRAYRSNYTLAQESDASNPAAFVALEQ